MVIRTVVEEEDESAATARVKNKVKVGLDSQDLSNMSCDLRRADEAAAPEDGSA